jgi:hypothetical protein
MICERPNCGKFLENREDSFALDGIGTGVITVDTRDMTPAELGIAHMLSIRLCGSCCSQLQNWWELSSQPEASVGTDIKTT